MRKSLSSWRLGEWSTEVCLDLHSDPCRYYYIVRRNNQEVNDKYAGERK